MGGCISDIACKAKAKKNGRRKYRDLANGRIINNKQVISTDSNHNDDGSNNKQYASMSSIQNDTIICDSVLKRVPSNWKYDKNSAIDVVSQNGYALKFATPTIQNTKEVVVAAVNQCPDAIKYAGEDLKRDPDVLIAAGMLYEKEYHDRNNSGERGQQQQQQREQNPNQDTGFTTKQKKVVLSTRFSLNQTSLSEATNFTRLFKQHEYIQSQKFKIYAPNAFNKQTCDPNWTNFDHPCRGTNDTCKHINVMEDGHPTDDCCWRYSFRSQLEEAKGSCGFMLQLIEKGGDGDGIREVWDSDRTQQLGDGQRIERHMAEQLKMKVFIVYRPEDSCYYFEESFQQYHINEIAAAIKDWYDDDCNDMSECVIRPTTCIGQ